jgi:hypothetical protein
MIYRLLKRTRTTTNRENPEKTNFSLGFTSTQTMGHSLDEILREASQTDEVREKSDHAETNPIPENNEYECSENTLKCGVFAKKTISKEKTFRGLRNPLKVPSYLKKTSSSGSTLSLPPSIAKNPIKSSTFPMESTPSTGLLRIANPSISSPLQQIRLSIGKELLKSAAACQMISIQEAHSMGGKLALPQADLLTPILSELLHRSDDSVQKILLQKISKSAASLDYFKSDIGNQSVHKIHSLLIPYKIVPIFYRGGSLTILAEHPLLIRLATALVQENQIPVSWVHCIPVEIQALKGVT